MRILKGSKKIRVMEFILTICCDFVDVPVHIPHRQLQTVQFFTVRHVKVKKHK